MKLIIDVAKFEEIICKHCMMKGENICPFDGLLLCPTIRKLEEPSKTFTDEEIKRIIKTMNDAIFFAYYGDDTIDKIKEIIQKIKGE